MSERCRSYQMSRLDLVRSISLLSDLLTSSGLTVSSIYVLGSQVSGGKPPRVDSDLDLLFMIDKLGSLLPRATQDDVDDCVSVLEERLGREVHVQTVSSGPFPSWLKDKNHKIVCLRRRD